MNNKEKIFNVAVDLFSEHGYGGVSIRQIAREVGIKESSIYNHYKSKEAILDAILDYYVSKMTEDEIPNDEAGKNLDEGIEHFYRAGLELYASKLKSQKMLKITRFVLIEMYHNEKIRNYVKTVMVEAPVSGWVELFEMMKAKGVITPDADSRQLAESFYYYGFFLMVEHFIINYPEDDEKFLKDLADKSERQMKIIFDSVKVGE
ncbi:TetR/AcrR family transcriptional regulator [Methanobrevibacter sp.]|uniref:TetR/AcrR family transcriptional regulator n=1 Tax=Methanobrevibacter sp. TaxID=66852 RepID=UPI00388FEE6E